MITCEYSLLSYKEWSKLTKARPNWTDSLCGKPAVAYREDKPGREYTPVCQECMKRFQAQDEEDGEYTRFLPILKGGK